MLLKHSHDLSFRCYLFVYDSEVSHNRDQMALKAFLFPQNSKCLFYGPLHKKILYMYLYIYIYVYVCVCMYIYKIFYDPQKVYTVGLVSNIFMTI